MIAKFPIRDSFEALALAIVAAHGVTDVDIEGFYWLYVFCMFVPSALVTPFMCTLSLLHFCEDFGWLCSASVHWLALVVAQARSVEHGMQVMFLYLLCAHVPSHYLQCVQQKRWQSLVAAASLTVVMWKCEKHRRMFTFSHFKQKIVIAHVLNELLYGENVS